MPFSGRYNVVKEVLGCLIWITLAVAYFADWDLEGRSSEQAPPVRESVGAAETSNNENSAAPGSDSGQKSPGQTNEPESKPSSAPDSMEAEDLIQIPTDRRRWTSQDGQEFIGRLMKLDRERYTVDIETSNGTLLERVSLEKFSDADQILLLGDTVFRIKSMAGQQ